MKYLKALLLSSLFLTSCGNSWTYEKDYYERISGLKIPEDFDVIETFDNGEFVTGTVFECNGINLKKFIIDNHFDSLENVNDIRMFGQGYFKKNKPEFVTTKGIFYIQKSKDRNNWAYIADLNTKRLWAEIEYPDWGGQ